jgi:hypothetical protein
VEWVRLPQCGEPKFKSWLEEVPYLVADTPQIGLPPVEETYGKPKKKKNCTMKANKKWCFETKLMTLTMNQTLSN